MKNNNYVVIMAGGIGSRFWPYSRTSKPKQFLDIFKTGHSLLQMTFDRFAKLVPKDNIYIITHLDYEALVEAQLPQLKKNQILLEPLRRNTAPCIAFACYKIAKINEKAVVTVAPSDHLITDDAAFKTTWKTAVAAAEDHIKLITIGLTPHSPETGYGYIQFLEGKGAVKEGKGAVKKVKTFTEKPEKALAEKFIESGDFVWNSGIFVWGVNAIKSAMAESLPEMADLFEEATPALNTKNEADAIQTAYAQSNNISIDYGIMEHSSQVYVVLGDFGWSDLGSWSALHEISDKDIYENAVQANALLYDTKNTLVQGPKDKLIIVQGLTDYLVAECDNVLLICKKNNEQKFRDFVADVKESKGKEFL
ncbi:MAG TPA: mannose-1-phosphate guanylyltransferase [Fulvivirga sp.]|nr:mannose-1-phosphate guanylyltransferase [Fulvivirga sp.]